jgi:hypothetical protein
VSFFALRSARFSLIDRPGFFSDRPGDLSAMVPLSS